MNTSSEIRSERIFSIDIMRGLTLVLMLFVNDLFAAGVPQWMLHTKANFDGMGLSDWVFPGFLFMVGMAIPFAIQNRLVKGDNNWTIFKHILIRTVSLLVIGVLMLNSKRLNPELAGINKNLWAVCMYVCVFLIWNNYPLSVRQKKLDLILKLIGIAGLGALLIIFKAGSIESPSWIISGWWGILGLIGWGYLAASLVYMWAGESLLKTSIFWCLFLILNICSQLNLLAFFNPVSPVLGVLIGGNIPFIVITGLLVSLILRRFKAEDNYRMLAVIMAFAVFSLLAGFFFRNWFIISKMKGTPSWTMICNGISMLVFVVLYYILDVKKKQKWAGFLKPAGQYSLTTYLAPDILYYTIWGLALPVLFYKQESSQLLAVSGSLVWALAMVGLTAILAKLKIRLKL